MRTSGCPSRRRRRKMRCRRLPAAVRGAASGHNHAASSVRLPLPPSASAASRAASLRSSAGRCRRLGRARVVRAGAARASSGESRVVWPQILPAPLPARYPRSCETWRSAKAFGRNQERRWPFRVDTGPTRLLVGKCPPPFEPRAPRCQSSTERSLRYCATPSARLRGCHFSTPTARSASGSSPLVTKSSCDTDMIGRVPVQRAMRSSRPIAA